MNSPCLRVVGKREENMSLLMFRSNEDVVEVSNEEQGL